MPASPLWQISVTSSLDAEEVIAALLGHLFGAPPSIYTDAQTRRSVVSIYCRQIPRRLAVLRAQLRARLKQIRECGLNIDAGRVAIQRVRREDWAESWKKHFQPLEFGQALLVKPSWSRRKPRAGQAVAVLDPGLSFGTGQHPTTAFCLAQLVTCRGTGTARSFLDLGTGSGILAIAAAKLGYHPIHALDCDPAALRIAKANARLNCVARLVRISRKDLTRLPLRRGAKFDVICANLTGELLVAQKKRILNRLQTRGTLILAGILKAEFEQVRRVYAAAGLKLIATQAENEWRSGTFVFQP